MNEANVIEEANREAMSLTQRAGIAG